jgi:methylmalonyl-CoA mutase, C-terminal domain
VRWVPGQVRCQPGHRSPKLQVLTRIRVVVAKLGLDGHDRGAKIVARALRDAGMEVIYTGLHRKPEEVVAAAVQEDADAIGVSILSGAHMSVFPRLIQEMKRQGIWDDVVLIGGGLVPDDEAEELKRLGVCDIIGQDAAPEAVVAAVRNAVESRRGRD